MASQKVRKNMKAHPGPQKAAWALPGQNFDSLQNNFRLIVDAFWTHFRPFWTTLGRQEQQRANQSSQAVSSEYQAASNQQQAANSKEGTGKESPSRVAVFKWVGGIREA